ncbi:unnamed protein product [Peronospora belbahrii]|uniref:PAP-associated domain-containing protein n=1 Tax=Peronospora belbahrii TaxID=622444 RepID=A0AAU9KMK6_9STRA|nr:unnamed protein product [Peronospora belbahrii]CAH0514183.1 unnamed protein product [Peronospora belbahrii]
MKRHGGSPSAASKRKKSRGRRKSKAERLARLNPLTNSSNDLHQLLQLLRSSRVWDAAQSLALQIGTLEARASVVCIILKDWKAPKAAAHYAKRLNVRGEELINAVMCDSTISLLLMAQFMVELDEDTLATSDRLQKFLWPWILQSMETKENKAVVKAAVHLMLHPTASDDAKMYDKKERGRRLQRALVTQCLKTGKLLHLVPIHARAFADRVSVDSVTLAAGHNEETNAFLSADQDKQEEIQRRQKVAHCVQNVLRLMWPDARVIVFGSSVTGLLPDFDKDNQKPADVDLCALLPSAPQFRQETASVITEVKEHLAIYFLPNSTDETEDTVIAVTGARIPIAHFRDPSTDLLCDLCVNNVSALWNTRLLRWFLYGGVGALSPEQEHQLQHVRRLCIWLRKWRQTKERLVGGAVSSYGLMLLAIYYLQRVGILPVLDCSEHVVEDECSLRTLTENEIDQQLERLDKKFVVKVHTAEVRDWLALRRGFFRFYACEFDYERTIVSLRTGDIMLKTSKGWSRQNDTRLCLEDPVETERDLGMLCSRRAFGWLRCAFTQACIVLSNKDEGTSNFLQDVEENLLASWAYEEDT